METRSLWMYGWLWNMHVWNLLWSLFGLSECWRFEQEWNTLLLGKFVCTLHSLDVIAWRGSWKVRNWGKHCWWCWSCPLLFRLRQLPNCSRNQATWRPFIKCALNICFSDVSRHAMKLAWNLFVLQSTNKPVQDFCFQGTHCKYLQLTYKSYLCTFSHNTSLLLFYVKKMQVLWFLQLMAAYMRLQWEMEHK